MGNKYTIMDYGTSGIFGIYCDMKDAGKKVLQWATKTPSVVRGKWMAQYLLFKMREMSFHNRLKKDDFVKVKMGLRDVDIKYIRDKTRHHRQTTNWGYNKVVQEQVLSFCVLHNNV